LPRGRERFTIFAVVDALTRIARALPNAGDRSDARRLPFPGASLDTALALLVVNFIPDRTAAVREMARVTRPGGVVGAAVLDYGGGMEMPRASWD
jgi:SAM-dependent methyltransferase